MEILPILTMIFPMIRKTTEFEFCPGRKWRFDHAWPEIKVAVELQGGILGNKLGGHSSTNGVLRDIEKSNCAQLLGWRVIPLSRHNLRGEEIEQTKRLLVGVILQSILVQTSASFINAVGRNHGN